VGHDHRNQDVRVFAVERISALTLTNRRFEIPSTFDFETFSQSAFSMIWGKVQEIEIRFSKRQAHYIQERTWHPSQSITDEKAVSIVLSLKVADLREVKRWLIGFGAEALCSNPPVFAGRLRRNVLELPENGIDCLREKHSNAGCRQISWATAHRSGDTAGRLG
jgi:predicted DNA-binding transcriptional regulator YafY